MNVSLPQGRRFHKKIAGSFWHGDIKGEEAREEIESNTNVSSDKLLTQNSRTLNPQVPADLTFKDFLSVNENVTFIEQVLDYEIIKFVNIGQSH